MAEENNAVDMDLIDDLKSINHSREVLNKEIANKEEQLNAEKDEAKKPQLQKELNKLKYKLSLVEDDMDNTAADLDIFADDEETDPNRDISKEVQDVLSPIIKSFKRMSARPRLVEKFRDQLANIDSKVRQIDEGLANIVLLEKAPQTESVKELLKDSKKRISDFKAELLTERKNIQKRLDEELRNNKNIWQAGGELFRDFFSDKGKNLIISLAVAMLIFGFMFIIKVKILRPIFRIEKLTAVSKPVMAFYGVFAGIISIIAALLCLFLLNDWLLFTLSIIVIGAILWAFKHLVVNFIGAIRVVLDMGTVREGERIMFDGCAWLVKRVGIRTHLVNEALEGGSLHVNIGQIKDHVSRPIVKDEPWFPTNKDDHVLLSDGTYGRVLVQTPNQVVLLLEDMTRKFYSLGDFVASRPLNLSDGFVVTTSVALDYEHQKKIFEIVELFERELKQKLPKNKVVVDFGDAGADSLNVIVKIVYDGSKAKEYLDVKSVLNSHVVDICNRNKLTIPFKQLTVHVEK